MIVACRMLNLKVEQQVFIVVFDVLLLSWMFCCRDQCFCLHALDILLLVGTQGYEDFALILDLSLFSIGL